MTYEEAIRKIDSQKLQFLEDYVDYSGISEAYDMAIEALEKQIPKKPIITRNEHSTRIIGYGCPACHKDVKGSDFYCWSCGQKLRWSE